MTRGDHKAISNIAEARARRARTIVLAQADAEEARANAHTFIELPKVSTLLQLLVATMPLQLFACELATQLGHDVDQPRNVASRSRWSEKYAVNAPQDPALCQPFG